MKELKIRVNTNVNCSSTSHHAIAIQLKFGDKWYFLQLSSAGLTYQHNRRNRFGDREWSNVPYNKFPAYLWASVADELTSIKSDDWSFYEYDRYGDKRTTDLRYHHRPSFDSLVEWAVPYIRNYNKQGQR